MNIRENDLGNIKIQYNEETKIYTVFCMCMVSEERAYRYGESCYKTKDFKYKKCAERFFEKLCKYSESYIIRNQSNLFK